MELGKIFRFCPLGNGDWFLSSAIQPFQKDGSASFFAKARLDPSTSEFRILELVGPDSKKLFQALPAKPGATSVQLELKPQAEEFVSLSLADILPAGKYLVVPLSRYGLLYLFSQQTGRLEKVVSIFQGLGEAQALHARVNVEAIVSVQARPDGGLMLITRSEDAVLNSAKIHPVARWESGQSMDQFNAVSEPLAEKSLKAFPDLFYWRFDPETADVVRIPVPKGFPGAVNSLKEFNRITLRYGLDGELRPVIQDTPKLPQKKAMPRKS